MDDWISADEYTPPMDYRLLVWIGEIVVIGTFFHDKNDGDLCLATDIGTKMVQAKYFKWRLIPKPPQSNTE